jgi:hypothetical protein
LSYLLVLLAGLTYLSYFVYLPFQSHLSDNFSIQGELEESRALLDSADRGKKQADMELAEARGAVNDMTTINSKANAEKRSLVIFLHVLLVLFVLCVLVV